MEVKAIKSFAGVVTMGVGAVKEVDDKIATDLLQAGYVEEVKKASSVAPKTTANKKEAK